MRRHWQLWLVASVGIAIIAIVWMSRGNERSGLPSRSAFGADIALENVRRIGPEAVELTLRASFPKGAKHRYQVLLDDPQVLLQPGQEGEVLPFTACLQYAHYPIPADKPVKFDVPIAPGAREITFELPVIRDAPEHHVTYRFKNVDAGKLPVTRRIGKTRVILRQIYVNAHLDPRKWEGERGSDIHSTDKFSGVVVEEWLPPDLRETNCRLRDEHGRYLQYDDRLYGTLPFAPTSSQPAAFAAISEWNVIEKATRLMNFRAGMRMHERRVAKQMEMFNANLIAPRVIMHTSAGSSVSLRRFSFEMSGILPPHADDKTTAKFVNVRVPDWRANP